MKKIISLLLCFILLGSLCITACAVTETEASAEFELEIDVEKRYTNISEMDDYHKTFLDVEDEKEQTKESRKMVYIVVLSILLVVAIVILIVSLKKVPSVEEFENKDVSAVLPQGDSADGSAEDRETEENL